MTSRVQVAHAYTAGGVHVVFFLSFFLVFFFFFFFTHFYSAPSGQAVVTSVVPSSPRFLPSIFISRIGFIDPSARQFFIECC